VLLVCFTCKVGGKIIHKKIKTLLHFKFFIFKLFAAEAFIDNLWKHLEISGLNGDHLPITTSSRCSILELFQFKAAEIRFVSTPLKA